MRAERTARDESGLRNNGLTHRHPNLCEQTLGNGRTVIISNLKKQSKLVSALPIDSLDLTGAKTASL
jgi:hypothetical protein